MDSREANKDYDQYVFGQMTQFSRIAIPLTIIGLSYFMYSDVMFFNMPLWALSRLFPISSFIIFYIILLTGLGEKRPGLLRAIHHISWFTFLSMSFSIAIIAWDSPNIQISVTALMVVSIIVFIGLLGATTTAFTTIFLTPSLLFVAYILLVRGDILRLAYFANSFAVIVALIAFNYYQDRLRRNKFSAESKLVVVNQELAEMADELKIQNLELQGSLERVKQLQGLIPICASCKKIRDDSGYWHQIETYIAQHSEADFSHGICPECVADLYPELEEDTQA